MQNHLTFSGYSKPGPTKVFGFTLIEVIIVITLAGILAAAAVPSFRSLIASQRIKTASFDVLAALTQTRSEAIKRNVNVTMTEAAGGWKNGWTIASGATLAVKAAYTGLSINESSNVTVITFLANGRQPTGSPTVKFTINASPSVSLVNPRCVSLSLSGQPSSSVGACS